MIYGAVEKSQGEDRAQAGYALQQQGAEIQQQAAAQQAGISKEQAASSVLFAGQDRDINILASQQSMAAAAGSRDINKSIFGDQMAIEAVKRQAMEVDARRQQLQIVRSQQQSRAMALVAATAQGGRTSSGLQGGYSGISGQSTTNLLGVQQALSAGEQISNQTQAISGLNMQMSDLTYGYQIQQAQNQTAKSNLTYNLAQANAGFQTRMADTQTLASQGAGLVARGGGQVSQGNMQIASGNSFLTAGPSLFNMGINADKLAGSSMPSVFGGLFGGGSPSGYSPVWQA